MNTPLNIFISYAQEDELAKNELTKHLESMCLEGLITSWDKQQVMAGMDWKQKSKQQLEEAQIILLLISSDAIASEYEYNHEIQKAIERHQAQTAVVIPILLRACDWTFLQKQNPMVALPYMDTETAVGSWKNKDEAYLHIAKNLRETVVHFDDILGGQEITHFWEKADAAQLKEEASQTSHILLIAMICSFIIASIALLTYFGIHPTVTPSNFNQTVFLRKGTVPLEQEGKLTITYGNQQEILPIHQGKGVFPIKNYQQETASFALKDIQEYELLHPDSAYLLSEKAIALQLITNKALLIFKGRVRDRQTLEAIPHVRITVANESFLTDSLGYFNKTLALDKPKSSYQLFAEKEGYEATSIYYNPQSSDADIRLVRKEN